VSADAARRWGWHALTPTWASALVADASICRGDLVLDVGAGTGAITAALVRRGARVVAVELHPGRCATLRDRFAGDDVIVVCADGADLRLPRRPFRVVSNPPFAITGQLLGRLTAPGSRLVDARLVVQRAAADRWATGHARGAARWGRTFEARTGRGIPRSAFRPPPPVACCELVLRRR
jgi:23S rRNA (adenine-N6)-dimethyltransferase